MTGIDTAIASLLASRIDSLLTNGVGSFSNTTTAQTGASALTGDTPALPTGIPGELPTAQASAQTVLSEVALTLDAISRFGGDATPALVGEAPIWPAPPAINVPGGATGELFPADSGAGAAAAQAQEAQGAALSAATVPVGALAAALAQAVSDSGLFYESHLAQWLSGLRAIDSLAAEPQTRLAAGDEQLPLAWGAGQAGEADHETAGSWLDGHASSPFDGGDAQQGAGGGLAGYAATARAPLMFTQNVFGANPNAAGGTGTQPPQPASSQQQAASQAQAGATPSNVPSSIAASIHPATIPLVRQQLDLLATDQFRWSGEVWPGTKLDWMIEPEGGQHAGRGALPDDEPPWRTRLTLALPTLGTVDAELTLTGTRLVARVQASPGGAARLAAQSDAFRLRLAAAGIELSGLSIREIGGGTPSAGPSAASAAFAYARSAAAGIDPGDVVDAEVIDRSGKAVTPAAPPAAPARPASTSPLERLFQDPFEWGGP